MMMKFKRWPALACVPVVLAASDAAVYLETTAGSALTVLGQYDSQPRVLSLPARGTAGQLWRRGPAGTWISVQNAAFCLAFEDVSGSSLTVRRCTDSLVYSDAKNETARAVKIQPRRSAAVDSSNRDAVIAFYQAQYSPGNPPPAIGFTGDVAGCSAGTTNPAFRAAVQQRVNFMRNLAGLADATLDDALSTLAQSSALMQAANGQLNHFPPATWMCYTDVGAQASGKSNLAQGLIGWNAVEAYVNEDGVLGHRRWVLFPALQRFGTGDVPAVGNGSSANALYVITGDPAPANLQTRDGFTAWPPKGFVPFRFAYPVWSFSVPKADFSGATVTIADGTGAAIVVNGASQLQNGFGDNTYSFKPVLPDLTTLAADLALTVTISNVMIGGTPQNFTYTVTLVDPNDAPSDLKSDWDFNSLISPLPANSLFSKLTVVDGKGGVGYTFTLVDGDGSADNMLFTVNGATLQNNDIVDFTGPKQTFNVRIRAESGRPNGVIEKALVVVSPFNN